MFHEMTLKLYFMKCSERKISQCILPLIDANFEKKIFPLLTKDFLPKFSELKVFHERASCVKNGT